MFLDDIHHRYDIHNVLYDGTWCGYMRRQHSALTSGPATWSVDWGEEECRESLPYVCDMSPKAHTATTHCYVMYNAGVATRFPAALLLLGVLGTMLL